MSLPEHVPTVSDDPQRLVRVCDEAPGFRANPAPRMAELVSTLASHDTVASACSLDDSPELARLGQRIAALMER